MRRSRRIVSLGLVLLMVVAAGLAPGFAAARQFEGDWGEGLDIDLVEGGNASGQRVQAYTVGFEPGAFVPEMEYPEALVVKVQRGTFAFRAQSDVLIDPQGSYIQVLRADPPIAVGDAPAGSGQVYPSTATTVPGCVGAPPTVLCLVNPTILGDNYVRLEPGFVVLLPGGTTCFFCNTTPLEEDAELLVWAPSSGFSWADNAKMMGTPTAGTPEAHDSSLRRGWMRLNPGSPCQ